METETKVENGFLKQSSHPVALVFHFLFRTLALILYLFGGLFLPGLSCFVCCVLFLAFDFWTVKNISGRLLVGLRWWNQILPDGQSQWIFESRENNTPNAVDSRMFWTALFLFPGIWAVLLLFSIPKMNSMIICAAALVMNVANAIGYTKCSKVLQI